MGRPREFDEDDVRAKARAMFAAQGYHGTSIDDLVTATGLLRGSLYKAFGSKRNLFERLLLDAATDITASAENLDLLTVALMELAQQDRPIRQICQGIVHSSQEDIAAWLGNNLLAKIKED